MWLISSGWAPPFGYRSGYIPERDIVARVGFSIPDPRRTEEMRERERRSTVCVYIHEVLPLQELRSALKNDAFQVIQAEDADKLDAEVWQRFTSDQGSSSVVTDDDALQEFQAALKHDPDLTAFSKALEEAFSDFEKSGLLENPTHKAEDGSQRVISVQLVGQPNMRLTLEVDQLRIATALSQLPGLLTESLRAAKVPDEYLQPLAARVFHWIEQNGLPATLRLDEAAMAESHDEVASKPIVQEDYPPGRTLAQGGRPLTRAELRLLRVEHNEARSQMSWLAVIGVSLAYFGMHVAIYILCGTYLYFHAPSLVRDLKQFTTLLAMVVICIGLCRLCAIDSTRAEIIPILLFGMTIRIAYQRELALLLSACVTLIVVLSLGQGLGEFVILTATVAAAVMLLNHVRSRPKLIYVGLGAATVAFLTTVGVGTLTGQTFGLATDSPLFPFGEDVPIVESGFFALLLIGSAWCAFCAMMAGLILTGLLPFIERLFDVQTDISLLELGDARHPLLQELALRAPGTYNHSINVASLGEAAAESINANGLLVRVGAYFHDIGKMLNPQYFIENQSQEANRHESLLPAMSTLVIIAHVKDGADLARQYRLPKTIIDFIEQHHGTTLVEYFYQQAAKLSEDDPDQPEVDDTDFRYPGPKPQTRESGVMMLADAAESASRSLVEPAPARIESLVHELAMKRLLDGQFDECGLTLSELNMIEQSLIKSLTAVYHGRVKYQSQHTA